MGVLPTKQHQQQNFVGRRIDSSFWSCFIFLPWFSFALHTFTLKFIWFKVKVWPDFLFTHQRFIFPFWPIQLNVFSDWFHRFFGVDAFTLTFCCTNSLVKRSVWPYFHIGFVSGDCFDKWFVWFLCFVILRLFARSCDVVVSVMLTFCCNSRDTWGLDVSGMSDCVGIFWALSGSAIIHFTWCYWIWKSFIKIVNYSLRL